LVLVITFAESLFVIFNWLAYWRDGSDPREALAITIRRVTPATALAMLTTFVAFASLSLAPGKGIQEFALAGAIGTMLSFVAITTFLPLLLLTALRLGLKLPKTPSFALTAPLPLSWFLASRFGRPMALAGIVVTLLFFIPYFLIEPRFSFEDFVAKGSGALDAAESIDEGVGGVAPIYVSVPLQEGVESVADADFDTIRRVHEILESHLGENKVISAASFQHYADSGFSRDEIFDAVGPFMKRRFVTDDGSQALITGFMPTIVESEELKATVAAVKAEIAAAGIEGTSIGGFRLLTAFATDDIVGTLQACLTMSVLLNLFLIGFAFQSWRLGLASVIPNLFPILGTQAWLWWSGAGLQMTTVLALTIAFGIAVDDTVHFLSHYLQGRRQHALSHVEAVKHTIERIGG